MKLQLVLASACFLLGASPRARPRLEILPCRTAQILARGASGRMFEKFIQNNPRPMPVVIYWSHKPLPVQGGCGDGSLRFVAEPHLLPRDAYGIQVSVEPAGRAGRLKIARVTIALNDPSVLMGGSIDVEEIDEATLGVRLTTRRG